MHPPGLVKFRARVQVLSLTSSPMRPETWSGPDSPRLSVRCLIALSCASRAAEDSPWQVVPRLPAEKA